jgi:hypothetical protein
VTAPAAPWVVDGEAMVALVPCSVSVGDLPTGISAMPGLALVVAARYLDSPVGPYLELAVGQPARLGPRPGWCFTTMVVNNPEARLGGRVNWGFPKDVGELVWDADGPHHELRWLDRDVTVRGTASRFSMPVYLPIRSLQRRADGPVVVPVRLRGWGRAGSVWVDTADGDDLAPLRGRHRGAHVGGLRLVTRPARAPIGLTSTLLAPLRAPEPALSCAAPGD